MSADDNLFVSSREQGVDAFQKVVTGVSGVVVGTVVAQAVSIKDPANASTLGAVAALYTDSCLGFAIDRYRWVRGFFDRRAEAHRRAGHDVSRFLQSPALQDMIADTIEESMRKQDERKLRLLLNAISNAALDGPPERDEAAVLMRMARQLTPTHIRMLDLLSEPNEWFKRHAEFKAPEMNAPLHEFLKLAVPNASEGRMLHQVWLDLISEGFIKEPVDRVWARCRKVTMEGLAVELLKFVRTPRDLAETD